MEICTAKVLIALYLKHNAKLEVTTVFSMSFSSEQYQNCAQATFVVRADFKIVYPMVTISHILWR